MSADSPFKNQEAEREPVIVYGGDITALRKLGRLYTHASRTIEYCSPRIAKERSNMAELLAQRMEKCGLVPPDDQGWEIWASQVAKVEAGDTDLPTLEMQLSPEELILHGLARELRAMGQIRTNQDIIADFSRAA